MMNVQTIKKTIRENSLLRKTFAFLFIPILAVLIVLLKEWIGLIIVIGVVIAGLIIAGKAINWVIEEWSKEEEEYDEGDK